jgi:hypothetical protein
LTRSLRVSSSRFPLGSESVPGTESKDSSHSVPTPKGVGEPGTECDHGQLSRVSSREPSQPSKDANHDHARGRLDIACSKLAAILDAGDRDPTWHETNELEAAAIALGRLLNHAAKGPRS